MRNRYLIGLWIVFVASGYSWSQPVASDPDLRLWLKADDLVAAGVMPGDYLTQWEDASSYGTIMAPRTQFNPIGPFGGFEVEESPTLQLADINGNMVPTVRFDRQGAIFGADPDCISPTACEGDPTVPGSGSTDRLYQTNNLAPNFDPLDIGNGFDLTIFAVFQPDVTSSGSLGFQTILGKRGTSESVYTMGIRPTGHFNFVVYDGITEYRSTHIPQEQIWHISAVTVEDNPTPNDTIEWYDDESVDPNQRMTPRGVFPQNTFINRNTSVPEPFGIGGHSQGCCGEGETFAGNIAELIIYAKQLDAAEFESIEAYLNNKYFADSTVDCDFDNDGDCDGNDIDALVAEIAAGNNTPSFDLTGDGLVDTADRDEWLIQGGNATIGAPYLLGDADLSGAVDGSDFGIWNGNKFMSIAAWTAGDFSADGSVDGSDFGIWNGNKFMSSVSASAVPEPASAMSFLLVIICLGRSAIRR